MAHFLRSYHISLFAHTHTHTHTYASMHTHTHTHTHMQACTHTHTHTCKHARTHTHTHMQACTHTHTHTCKHVHTHTHTHTHTRKHAHTHTHTHASMHTYTHTQGCIPIVERGAQGEGVGGACPPSQVKWGSSDTTGNTKAQKALYIGLQKFYVQWYILEIATALGGRTRVLYTYIGGSTLLCQFIQGWFCQFIELVTFVPLSQKLLGYNYYI